MFGYAIASLGPLPLGLNPFEAAPRGVSVCSSKFLPTVSRLMRVVMPRGPKSAEAPIPESWRSFGVCSHENENGESVPKERTALHDKSRTAIAPAAKITSLLAYALNLAELDDVGANSMPVAFKGMAFDSQRIFVTYQSFG
jgi:hypothetical protein